MGDKKHVGAFFPASAFAKPSDQYLQRAEAESAAPRTGA